MTSELDLGIGLLPGSVDDAIASAVAAAQLGIGNIWMLDTPCLAPEAFTTLGAIRARLRHVVLGTGVTNLTTRHESVLASAFSALDRMSPGRVVLGVGTGDSAVRMIGRKPTPLDHLEGGIARLRALLRGLDVQSPDGLASYGLWQPSPTIPIYVAGAGPKLLELAGRIADGVILGGDMRPEGVTAGLERIERGAKAGGRKLEDLAVVLWAPFSVAEDGYSARMAVRSYVARAAIGPSSLTTSVDDDEAVVSLRKAYDYRQHMAQGAAFEELVTDSLIDHFAIAGTRQSCEVRIDSLRRLPIHQLAVVPYPPAQTTYAATLQGLVEAARIPAP